MPSSSNAHLFNGNASHIGSGYLCSCEYPEVGQISVSSPTQFMVRFDLLQINVLVVEKRKKEIEFAVLLFFFLDGFIEGNKDIYYIEVRFKEDP